MLWYCVFKWKTGIRGLTRGLLTQDLPELTWKMAVKQVTSSLCCVLTIKQLLWLRSDNSVICDQTLNPSEIGVSHCLVCVWPELFNCSRKSIKYHIWRDMCDLLKIWVHSIKEMFTLYDFSRLFLEYWHQRADERQCKSLSRWPGAISGQRQSWKTPGELGASKSMECDIFPFDTVGWVTGRASGL